MDVRKLGETIYRDIVTHNPLTGINSDADSTPTCEVFENNSDVAILTPTIVKREAKTGNYRIQIDLTTANGFELLKSYNVVVTAIVGGVTAKLVIESFTIDSPARPIGTVVAGTNSATTFCSSRTEATNDFWKDCFVRFLTGGLSGQVRKVTGYNGSTFYLSFSSPGFTAIPSNGDIFELVNS